MKLLVFDMGHVFVDFEWEAVCQGFCSRAGCTLDDLRPVFAELSELGYESGRIDTPRFLAELNQRLGSDICHEEFAQLWVHTFRENEQMAELLQKLKKQRPLYLLSNTNEIHYEWLQAKFNVARHFESLILSYQVGSSKPEEEIYRHVLERSGFDAKDVMFVDDLPRNVATASRLGMHAHQFVGIEPLKNELRKFELDV